MTGPRSAAGAHGAIDGEAVGEGLGSGVGFGVDVGSGEALEAAAGTSGVGVARVLGATGEDPAHPVRTKTIPEVGRKGVLRVLRTPVIGPCLRKLIRKPSIPLRAVLSETSDKQALGAASSPRWLGVGAQTNRFELI
jgi:hypothetical protein